MSIFTLKSPTGNIYTLKAPENTDEEECRRISTIILERAFRRPLTSDEKEKNIDRIFKEVESPDVALKRVVLLAIKSPQFLYPGLSGGKDASFQIASRLALGLWDSIPDNELLDIAKKGGLNDIDYFRGQVHRMLTDSRSKSKVLDFFYHWLDLDYGRDIAKDKKVYPGFDFEKISNLKRSMDIFIEDVFWSERSNFNELFLDGLEVLLDFEFLEWKIENFFKFKLET